MEFEFNKTSSSPDISDAQRLAASGKHITLNPIHSITHSEPSISPREDVPLTMQLSNPKVYIAVESEDTSQIVNEAVAASPPATPVRSANYTAIIAIIAAALVAIGAIVFIITNR